jgi:hypothetical protein
VQRHASRNCRRPVKVARYAYTLYVKVRSARWLLVLQRKPSRAESLHVMRDTSVDTHGQSGVFQQQLLWWCIRFGPLSHDKKGQAAV